MRVNPNQLETGCILANDISCMANQPLMRKKTVLNEEHIKLLQIFLVDEVDVEAKLANGKIFKPKAVIEKQEKVKPAIEESYLDLYLKSVDIYKKLYKGWQAGTKVDILPIRKIILPLIDKVNENKFDLHKVFSLTNEEEYIYHHTVTVSILASYIGKKMGFSRPEEIQLALAGMMADCGMSKILTSIVKKKGPLLEEEFDEIKKHPMYSYQMLKEVPGITEAVLLAVLQHHERNDGSGYPLKLSQQKIHQFSKIISVVDVFHAMISDKPYSSKQSKYKAIEVILEKFGQFDHKVVQNLTDIILDISIGKSVKLSTGDTGEIIFIEQNAPTRPMIKLKNGEFLKLIQTKNVYIEEVLN